MRVAILILTVALGLPPVAHAQITYHRATSGVAFKVVTRVITNAEMLDLHATPIVLLAPKAGVAYLPWAVSWYRPAGVAYADIAAGDDMVLQSTTGVAYATLETTGWLDQVTVKSTLSRLAGGSLTEALVGAGVQMALGGAITGAGPSVTFSMLYVELYPAGSTQSEFAP